MLTVEIVTLPDGSLSDEVEIYLDDEGLDQLIQRLTQIKNRNTDHVHFMSQSWGLGNLDEVKHKATNRVAHHLRITFSDI